MLMNRRLFLTGSLLVCTGCTGQAIQRSQSPEAEPAWEPDTPLVGNVSRTYGMDYIKLEAVSLVTGLSGTGEDPPPTTHRAMVKAEMQRRNVDHSDAILSSPDTALVITLGYLRPGIQKGDRFDVEVHVPSRSEAESLRGGFLLEARLSEHAVLGNQLHQGHTTALAAGPVLVAPSSKGDKEDRGHQTRGRVLGGGVALKSRTLGLVLHDEEKSIRLSQQIGKAINQRFHTYQRGVKQGVAVPKTDEYIELDVHPHYKGDISRYVQVVRSIAIRETASQRQGRLQLLQRQLLDPVTCATAALRLEAIGKDAIEILKKGLETGDPEIRFHSAQSLAYLDQIEAAEPLAEAARNEPAFRVHALSALTTLNDAAAHEQLRGLLEVRSAETRYGAFRALWKMAPDDPLVHGEQLGGQFSYHLLDTQGPPMIHVTRSVRPEVVLFGQDQHISLPVVLEAGKHIMVNGLSGSRVTVSRFAVDESDQKRLVSTSVDEVIRAIVELGGTYPDVVQALQQAKDAGALSSRLMVDALPTSHRKYDRRAKTTARISDFEPEEETSGGLRKFLTPWKNLIGDEDHNRRKSSKNPEK